MRNYFPKIFLYILGLFFLLNLLQAWSTQLIFDEAYYWYYAREISWGYFDHPPMVAWLIALGQLFFEGELGVRFLSCILGIGTMAVLWLLVDDPKKKDYIPHFFVLIASMTLVHAYGFLMLPDTPLLFFTALFFLVYKRFLASPGVQTAILLGLVMAALMYSKYHAFLVIFFVFLSNPGLIRERHAWLAVLISLTAYSPHLMWLYDNHFVSVRYHLFERPNRPYEFFDFTAGYFINLIAIFGLTFYWIYRATFKTPSRDLFTKALLFVSIGILLFFFISSFQRRVQTQWIIVICIPMAVLAYRYMLNHESARKWIFRMGLVNICILMFLRIGLVFEPLFPVVYETHGNRTWVKKITSRAGDIPVVFENSYRMAPMFEFYTGIPSFSLNNAWYRENQYSIDASENRVRNKKVLYVSRYLPGGDISFTMPDSTLFYGVYMDPFRSYRKLRTEIIDMTGTEAGERFAFEVRNPYSFGVPISELKFGLETLDRYKQILKVIPLTVVPGETPLPLLPPGARITLFANFPSDLEEEAAFVKVVISENGLRWGLNGKRKAIE
ncbi:Dolichyl-phosphate-mannose-protein mannosyltransferase [Muriicola jejuensis]|uniref:4-amino-4-deoxy-L-arabinose transferase n=1 Tax=Muriicola jejuensis TaxID=504488 RepID=A0A6P0UCT3_9FLAO|nr:glycosyltransferase family 39 protein [Muriicola jejuensis]NER10290.1 4-amino-4-deoxy-L-arabinose transferase [Muriicola jejuensis]SMP01402.1 Dolichyl-phosphate-mannose-protein mannosyltransferase [Muriicola jejuensis]